MRHSTIVPAQSPHVTYSEAYSWGVGEYDSEDGVDGGEGWVRAAVVGVEDTPGFQLGDTSKLIHSYGQPGSDEGFHRPSATHE